MRMRAADAMEENDATNEDHDFSATIVSEGVDKGHMWIKCVESNWDVVARAVFAEKGDMTPEKGDYIAFAGYGAKKWFLAKIESVVRGAPGDFRYRIRFMADGKWEKCQLLDERYGQGLREAQWGKKEAKTRLGWMFLRPTTEVGGNILASAASIFDDVL